MFQTLCLGQLSGIRIYIHWSFWWLSLFLFVSGLSAGFYAALAQLGFVFAVFACVFLHELGHAMAGRLFRIQTRDITLLPFGGIARMESLTMPPLTELVVALAGPAVNFVIAVSLLVGFALNYAYVQTDVRALHSLQIPEQLAAVNLFLAVTNLFPAFPLDGGRVLRAILGFGLSHARATEITARIGQIASIGLFLVALYYGQFFLAFIAFVLVLANLAEWLGAKIRSAIEPLQTNSPYNAGPMTRENTIDAVEVRNVEPDSNKLL